MKWVRKKAGVYKWGWWTITKYVAKAKDNFGDGRFDGWLIWDGSNLTPVADAKTLKEAKKEVKWLAGLGGVEGA